MLFAVCALWAQRDLERDESPNPLEGKPEAVEAGRKLFGGSCGACHGPTGEGGRGPNLREGRLIRRLSEKQLFTSIQKGVPGTDMPPSNLPDEQIWQLALFVRSLSEPAFEAIVSGSPDAGSAIFFGKGNCSGCHLIQGRGGLLAPDLSNIGMARSVEQLREALLRPGARIVDGFQRVEVLTSDGRKIEGVARNNTNYNIQIQDARGGLHLLSKSDLREVVFYESSWMPADYAQRLSAAEAGDVIAFLSRQSLRPASESSRERRRNARNPR